MLHSCAQMQRPAPGARALSPTSQFASSRSHQQQLPKAGSRGLGPGFSFSRVSSSSSSSSSLGLSSASEHHDHLQRRCLVVASLKPPSGKGFGKKNVGEKKTITTPSEPSEDTSSSRSPPVLEDLPSESPQYQLDGIDDDDVVPEVVTNRMLKRIAFTVGVPLGFGLLLFPAFYYLKIVSKVDVPEWLPLVVSMVTFGTAGFGITYGVVSSSWDPARDGSLLGWKEAQVNWPLIWDKFQDSDKKK